MEKINIAELLKDCPKGMELDCTMFEGVVFHDIVDRHFPIRVRREQGGLIELTANGCIKDKVDAKCVIFPKGKTTWEGFVPPCKFKAGDVLVSEAGNIVLLSHIDSKNIVHYHCIIPTYGSFRIEENTSIGVGRYYDCFLANEQQKQRMYDRIKCSGYKYNQSTNKLEKLIKLKFKVGDRIQSKKIIEERTIKICEEDGYWTTVDTWIRISDQDDWELVPNKFDINTLVPFESRVLVRDFDNREWRGRFFSHYKNNSDKPYVCIGAEGLSEYKRCIPFKSNEHLLGKTDDCNKYFKTWE